MNTKPLHIKQNYLELNAEWLRAISPASTTADIKNLQDFLEHEIKQGYTFYPPQSKIFAAFNSTPLSKVKVVILGQDPYHGAGQAMGLSFSVPQGVKLPPSLRNIFKELVDDLGVDTPSHGDLSAWAKSGVLLLNTSLTVRANEAASHSGAGWEKITDAAISAVSEHQKHVVFMLWGSYAQKKVSLIDTDKHLILKTAHPSPLSARRGFFGCKHFSQANEWLIMHDVSPVDW